ncbi:MAG TPA: hypothetical protein VFT43_11100 [Candidatus Polarisedimenticolia bacterium]|nr:hypothetical protein [Candidatus Polarisedimenticolia bacterium]
MMAMTGVLVLGGLLLAILAFVAAPILLALVLVAAVVRLVFFVLLLPLRLLGWGLGFAFKGIFLLVGVALLILVGLVPLVPVLLVGGLIYFLVKASGKSVAPAGH